MGWHANSLSARILHLLHKFDPGLSSVRLFLPTSSNTIYSLSGIGCFDKTLLCPHEDGQEQRLSSTSIKFLWLKQIHDPSGISPALDDALSTLLSCCWLHFFPVRVLSSFTHLRPVVTLSNSDSKQISATTSFRMSALLPRRTFLVNVEKNYWTWRRRKNYRTINCKNKNLNFAVFRLTLANFSLSFNFFFAWRRFLQWFQLNFRAANFRGRLPGTSALRF